MLALVHKVEEIIQFVHTLPEHPRRDLPVQHLR